METTCEFSTFPKLHLQNTGNGEGEQKQKNKPNQPNKKTPSPYISTGFCGFQLEKKKKRLHQKWYIHSTMLNGREGMKSSANKSEQDYQAQM